MTEKKLANTGDKVLFHRKGRKFIGEVVKVKDESVLVTVNQKDAKLMDIETPITVVSHKRYQLV